MDLKTIKEIAYQMGARNKSPDEVQQMFNLDEEELNKVVCDQEFGGYLLNAQTAAKVPMPLRIQTAAEIAYKQRLALMLDPKTDQKTKEKISQDFMDRAYGRPVQRTESKNVNVNMDGTEFQDLHSANNSIEDAHKRVKLLEKIYNDAIGEQK